jgi:DMSO/TMAO reductase YedYZ molybdopterin-dependent catalytic subunit
MSIVNKGFRRGRGESTRELPPGQHLTADFPVLQAGPTPRIDLDDWRFTIRDELGAEHSWTWA